MKCRGAFIAESQCNDNVFEKLNQAIWQLYDYGIFLDNFMAKELFHHFIQDFLGDRID